MGWMEITLIAAVALNVAAIRWLHRRGLITLPPRVMYALTALNVSVILLHVLTQDQPYTAIWWFFNVNFEHNFNTLVSALLLLTVAALALAAAVSWFARSQQRLGVVWAVWGGMYLFLAYDESYMVHEAMQHWKLIFAALGALLGLAALAGAWWDRANRALYLLLIVGLGLTAAGGVGLDDEIRATYLLEEFLELSGTTLVLAATYTSLRRSSSAWPRVRRVLWLVHPAWVLVMLLVGLWPLPTLEARWWAQPAAADYLDGALSLLGYQLEDRAYQPGDWVKVTLYWRANQPLAENYAQSVRLLRPPAGDVMEQADLLLGPPTQPSTNTWPTGMVFHTDLYLQTEPSLPAPASYWLSLNVWRAPWDDHRDDNMLLVSQTDQTLLLPDTLVLDRVAFVSPEPVPPAPQAVDYRFSNQIRLTGYHLPVLAPGQDAPLRFWWQTDAAVDNELVQFLHLHHTGSDAVVVADHPPLLDTFPTADWPAGLQVVGEWPADLLGELPPGEYDVFTGLYEQTSAERLPVADAQGQPAQDYRIYLGRLRVEAG